MGWFFPLKRNPVKGEYDVTIGAMLKDIRAHGYGFPDTFTVWETMHYMFRQMADMRDRIVALENGRVLRATPPEAVKDAPGWTRTDIGWDGK